MKPTLAISMGDPAGIGPEILVRAAAVAELRAFCRPVVYGDSGVLTRAVGLLKLPVHIVEHAADRGDRAPDRGAGPLLEVVPVSQLPLAEHPFGRVTEPGSRAMARYIRRATEAVLEGRASGIVTCPITKEGLRLAGEPFPGHTEMLASLCGGAEVVMMLAGDRLRVALVTTHVALRDAVDFVTTERVVRTIRITDRFFRERLGMPRPRIGVAGLNPHAGEGGLFGDEESRVIAPAIEACRASGIDATGPHPADTLFVRAHRGAFDVAVAMTHDQGLGPLKLAHFDDAVNVTMGLPIIRTSVDHGTAYDIAGRGIAEPASLIAALRLAAHMATIDL